MKKIVSAVILTLILLSFLTGCFWSNPFVEEKFEREFKSVSTGDGFYLVDDQGFKYVDKPMILYLKKVYDKTKDRKIGKCDFGYVLKTSSEYVVIVENLHGGAPCGLTREDYSDPELVPKSFSTISVLDADSNVLSSFDDEQFKCELLDIAKRFECDDDTVIKCDIDQVTIIGEVALDCVDYPGMSYNIDIVLRGGTWFLGRYVNTPDLHVYEEMLLPMDKAISPELKEKIMTSNGEADSK